MKIPTEVNGYPVIAATPRKSGGLHIIVKREGHPVHPYVMASWHENNPNEWSWGHYCETLEEATDEMNR